MSGRYSLNTYGNIIKYDYIRSNIGIAINPDIFARLKVNSIGSGETNDLWISTLFGGNNDNLHKVAIGTLNSNSCVGAVDKLYNFTDLYLNSDTTYDNYGDVYIIGNVINSNNVYIQSNLNINGNVGIGKYASSIRLDVNGIGSGSDANNWITASIGSSNNNLNRVIIGVINSNAIIGSYNFNNSNITWTPLIINGDGNGNGCNVIIDTNLYVNSNLSILNGNVIINSGSLYSNAIFIGTSKNSSTIYSYNNYTKKYNTLYLNSDQSNIGNDVIIQQNLYVNSNILVNNDINIKGHLNIDTVITNTINSWISATFCTSNTYDNRAIIGVYNSNVIIGSIANNYSAWKPLYLNGDILSGKGSDVYVVNTLNVYSNINILSGNLGIGTTNSSNKLHIYNEDNTTGDVGIIIENKNKINNKNITSIKLNNDTSNSFNIYLNSSKGGIYKNDITSNSAVLINTAGNLLLQTKNNKGISILEDATVILDSNLFIRSNIGIGIQPTNNNKVSILGNIALYDNTTLNPLYNYNIYTDKLYSNLTWVLPNRYPNSKELFTYNNTTQKLDWINIADFNIDYWNIGNSNNTGYLTISQQSNVLFPNNFKIGFKSSNISIGNYIYRRYPKNIYTNGNISYDFTDFNYNSFIQNDITFANNNRIFIKRDTATYGFNLIRIGVIVKKYHLYSSNIINNNLTSIENYFNNNVTPYTYDIINTTNAFNFSSSSSTTTEISFLFIPTISTNYIFTIKSQYYYGSLHIDTINSSDGSYSTTNIKYPYLFDYSNDNGTNANILLPLNEVFGNSITSFTANSIYRILIRVIHLTNNANLQIYYTNDGGSLQKYNIFNDTTSSIYYKLTNSRYSINYTNNDYVNNNTYKIDTLLINDIADSYYYSKKYLTNYSNILNPFNTSYWSSDKIFNTNGDIDTSIVYYGLKDTTIGAGSYDMSGFTKDGNSYTLASYTYNPISQNTSSSYGTCIIYTIATDIKLVTYGILISTDIYSAPSKWQLYGSVTGLTNTVTNNYWDLLDDRTSSYYNDYRINNISYFSPNYNQNANNYYKYFAIVVSSIVGSSKQLSISSIIFNGIDSTYSIDSHGNVSDQTYLNDILSLNYYGDVGLGISNPKYKLDVGGNINSYNLHTSGFIISDNDITTSTSIYSSNLVVYGDIAANNGVIASTIWGELHGRAYLYTPYIYGNTNLDGNLNVTSNIGIGTNASSRIRLDINSLGTGFNEIDWIAARIGGSISSNNLVLGTINNYSTVGSYNDLTGNWSELLLNGNNVGSGANVIVSTNLKINSNLYVSSNVEIGSNLYVNSNVGIGRLPNTNYRLDVNSYGTGNNNVGWAAARFGGMINSNRVVIGTINNNATIGAINDINGSWSELLLNGDRNGGGCNVIVSTNLYVNSNIQVSSNIGIGKIASSSIRLDVSSYGTGNNNINWVAGRFGGTTSTNNIVIGTINNYPCIGGNNNTNNWSPIILNGDGNGNGANVMIDTNLLVGSNINLTCNLYVNGNAIIGSTNSTGKLLNIYGNISTIGNDISNGLITSSGGINATGGNITLNSSGGLTITNGTGANISGATNIIASTNGANTISATNGGANILIGTTNNIVATNNFLTGTTSNCINSPATSVVGNLTIYTGSASGKLDVYGLITGYNGFTLKGSLDINGSLHMNTSGIILDSGGIVISAGGLSVSGTTSLMANTNLITSSTLTTITGPLLITGGTTTNIANTTSFTLTAPTTNITNSTSFSLASPSIIIDSLAIGIGTSTDYGTITVGSTAKTSKSIIVYGNIEARGTADANNGKIIAANGITMSAGDFTVSSGNLIVTVGSSTIGNNLTIGSVSQTNRLLSIYGNIQTRTSGSSDGSLTVANGLIVSSGSNSISGGTNSLLSPNGQNIITASGGTNSISAGTNTITATSVNNITGITNTITGTTNTAIVGPFSVNGLTTATGGITTPGNISVTGSGILSVSAGGITNSGNLSVSGNETVTGTITVSGLSYLNGGVSINNGLSISGTTTINGNFATSPSGTITSAGGFITGSSSTFNGNVTIGNSATLTVGGSTVATGGVTTSGNLITTGSGTITSASTITSGGLLTVSSGGLTVTSGNLAVSSGTSTLNGTVTIGNSGTLIVGNTSIATGYVTSTGNIYTTSTGAITSSGKLTASSGFEVTSGSSAINGNVTIGNGANLTVAGLVTCQNGLTVSSGTTTLGTTALGTTTTGSITASGAITANGGITMPGTITAGTVTTTAGGSISSGANGNISSGTGGNIISGGSISSTTTATIGGDTTIKGGSLGCTLSVTGTIGATSDIGLVSDERLKTDITTIDNALEKVNKLRGVYYKRNNILDKNEDIDRIRIGLIAQEVEKIIPEAILINEDSKEKYRSVIYQNMVGLLIEAIKEIDIKYEKNIKDLTERINMLENNK